MAFFVKYRFEFSSLPEQKDWKIDILLNNYSGDILYRDFLSSPELRQESTDNGVAATSLSLAMKAIQNDDLFDIYTTNGRKYKVELYLQNSIYWTGYIVPEIYGADWVDAPYQVFATATDGIGFLKNETYQGTGRINLLAIINNCLLSTGLTLGYEIINSIRPYGANEYDTLYNYVTVDDRSFDGKSKYDVLSEMMISTRAKLSQRKGRWHIQGVVDDDALSIFYSSALNLQYPSTNNPANIGSKSSENIYPIGQLGMTVIPAKKSFNITFERRKASSLFQNADCLSDVSWNKGMYAIGPRNFEVNDLIFKQKYYILKDSSPGWHIDLFQVQRVQKTNLQFEIKIKHKFVASARVGSDTFFELYGSLPIDNEKIISKLGLMITLNNGDNGETPLWLSNTGWKDYGSIPPVMDVITVEGTSEQVDYLPNGTYQLDKSNFDETSIIFSSIPYTGDVTFNVCNLSENNMTNDMGTIFKFVHLAVGGIYVRPVIDDGYSSEVVTCDEASQKADDVTVVLGDPLNIDDELLINYNQLLWNGYKTNFVYGMDASPTQRSYFETILFRYAKQVGRVRRQFSGVIGGSDIIKNIYKEVYTNCKLILESYTYALADDEVNAVLLEVQNSDVEVTVGDITISESGDSSSSSSSSSGSGSTIQLSHGSLLGRDRDDQHPLSSITGLVDALAAKLDITTFSDLFEKVNIGTTESPIYVIRAKYNFCSIGWISARGYNSESGGGGGSSYSRLDAWADYDASKSGWVLSAGLGYDLNTRVASLENGSALDFTTTGAGNAVTSVVKNGTAVTITKGSTFALASHAHDYIPTSQKGTAGGVAELDVNGLVPSSQLPSYVDDVIERSTFSAFPATGETGKIYVATDNNITYRWSGTAYVEISASLALGETSSTAYRGDRGKTAYDHSQLSNGSNPHATTFANIVGKPSTYAPSAHTHAINDVNNLSTSLAAKLDITTFSDLFEKVNVGTAASPIYAIQAKYNLYSLGWVSARGYNSESGGGSSAYTRLDTWTGYNNSTMAGYVLSAGLGYDMVTRIASLESGSALSLVTSGSGNAVTSVTKSGTAISVVKGSTFSLSGHNHDAAYVPLSRTIAGVALSADVGVSSLQSALGLGTAAYTASTSYAAASHTHTKAQITDFPTSLPASDVYAWAKAATKPSYTAGEVGALSLSGGTMTGNLGIIETKNILLRLNNANYHSGIGYDTSGNECIALWAKNTVTRLRWHAGLDLTNLSIGSMMSITPDFEISKASGIATGYIGGKVILHSGNYNSYSPTLTGSGASGTWGINITGNASTATNLSRSILAGNGLTGGGALNADRTLTLGTPSNITATSTNSVTASSHTHNLVMGAGSGLDADLLDGKHWSDIINGNVASATKLQTPRTIWGQSFDGTANISGNLTASNFELTDIATNPYLRLTLNNVDWYIQAYTGYLYLGAGISGNSMRIDSSGNVSVYNTLTSSGTVTAPTFSGALLGNASTATKLQTPRTIWGQSFDGTGNVSGAMTGVSTISASGNITSVGYITSQSYITARVASDIRLKENVKTIYNGLSIIRQLRPIEADWNSIAERLNPHDHKGHLASFIAQEYMNVLPFATRKMSDGYFGIDNTAVIPYLTSAVTEVDDKVAKLEKRVEYLENELKKYKAV